MPKERQAKIYCVDNLRHAEYYQMQECFDELYAQSSQNHIFTNLMDIVLSRENILLAYRNIKSNSGSNTPGTDRLTIKNIGRLNPEEVVEKVRFIVAGSKHGYRPKPVSRCFSIWLCFDAGNCPLININFISELLFCKSSLCSCIPNCVT